MIFATSLPRFKTFLSNFSAKASDLSCCLLMVTGFLLPAARRSVASASRSLLSDVRNAGWLLRWLGGSSAPQALLAAAQDQLHQAAARDRGRLHVLLIDSTLHSTQGRCTANTFSCGNTQARPKKSDRHQKKVHRKSAHLFVCALLLTPRGLRIPYFLPFYTKAHCELFGRRHRTQADLAAQLIAEVKLPPRTPVVVAADTAFEAKQVRKACAQRGWSWVVPLNPERRLAGEKPRPKVRSLYQQLSATDFRRVSFRLDQGELAPLARVSPKRSSCGTDRRTYWVHQRTATVLNVGEVTLLFSNKSEPTTAPVTVQKLLISNWLDADAEQLLRVYSLRWQVELFFKEMKSQLGMCDYRLATGPFERVVNWVSLSLTAFCYLEWWRYHRQNEARGKDKAFWQRLRAHGLQEQLRRQAQRADLEELLRLAVTTDGAQQLNDLLTLVCDDPDPKGLAA